MTTTVSQSEPVTRSATTRHLLMCSPEHFTVRYSINPWMNPEVPVDRDLALEQWTRLRGVYERLGHRVEVLEGAPGLPDMVFTANAAVVHGGRALVANFAHPQRQPESAAFLRWFRQAGYAPAEVAALRNEGEGDILTVGRIMFAGNGSRTSLAAHDELREFFGMPVISLDLVDPRFYHLDTALAVLDPHTVAYYPGAFSDAGLAVLEQLFPGAILANEDDACAFGLNVMCDGYNVVMSDGAPDLAKQYEARGFNPIGVGMSELMKSGGSVKCCTLELR
ncbi:N-dimethylarginine dimethylaminohydrolase [Kineosporia sp. J2-2]|uniref:N-dimethylarginine dimethylaminohydrolase n=1 Tax=Kineosporia corallincola TaxID=2835133 RepID=A0ABS5TG86_9ACTN|nr:dimethylargininase [Kineosporia corallincola]MBT0770072.1 N-dimethylarginine dimethylaminohydrolase [Kineosporia corallincola]